MNEELSGYRYMFLDWEKGASSTIRATRNAFLELKYAAEHMADNGALKEEELVDTHGITLNHRSPASFYWLTALVGPGYKTLHIMSQLRYPAGVTFTRQQIQAELDRFEDRMTRRGKSFSKLISRLHLQTEPRHLLKANARPFRNYGSPAAFYCRLQQVVLQAVGHDIFQDPQLNFSQIRALHPGPRPYPSICFFDDTTAVARRPAWDPVLFEPAECEGETDRQTFLYLS